MRFLIAALCLSLLSEACLAQSATVFPPDDCTSSISGLISWRIGDSTTRCKSGQDVLRMALPNCGANQQVIYDGSSFICEDKSTGPSPCDDGQVLTYTTSGYICVAKGQAVPQCKGDQFLTYNGAAFQCASIKSMELPRCGTGQMLSSDGNKFICVDAPSTSSSLGRYQISCAGGVYSTSRGCAKINTQTGSVCMTTGLGASVSECLPGPISGPSKPVGTYQVSCQALAVQPFFLCTKMNTQTGATCDDPNCTP